MLPFFGVQHFFYCPVTCVLFYKTELFELTHCLFYGHIKSFTDKLIEIIINNNFEALYSFETLFLRCNIFDSQYWGSRELVTFMLGSCTCGYADVTYRSQLLNNNKKKALKPCIWRQLTFLVCIATCVLPMSLNLVASGHSAPTRNPMGLHSYCLPS